MEDSALATLLILISAVLHAMWNAAVKKSDDKFAAIVFVTTYGGLLYTPFIAFVPFPDSTLWGWIAASMALHLFYQMALAAALERGALTFAYPVARGTGPLLVGIFAYFALNEGVTLWKLAAIAVLVCGIFITARVGKKEDSRNGKALPFALLTGCMIASYTVVDGLAVRSAETPLTFIIWAGVAGSPLIFLVGIKQRGWGIVSSSLKVWKLGMPAAVLAHGGYALALTAYTLGSLGEIAALRETSIIFATIIGVFWLKEPFSKNKLAAISLIALGALLLKLA
ncbi:MAG: EamA family transporter [Kordiimonadaceae bacterium]|nr:EamA family transporter [Kordiimonadaceae bacterium]